MAKKDKQQNTFHLGLTMAGAVSAGCYTAGVMDYMFEVLDLWDRAKKGEVNGISDKLVPKNNVVIDAMGGASAGGMTTIMTALYALKGKINPVKELPKNPLGNFNLLYDSWVHLDDDDNKLSFEKIWDVDDLKDDLISLFNSNIIDNIAKKAFKDIKDDFNFQEHIKDHLPEYISKDLEILLSHALLRGIPLSVDFKTDVAKRVRKSPKHNTFEHFLVSHFKLNNGKKIDEKKYMWLNPYQSDNAKKMILSTISTGAFPVGLAYREFGQQQFNDDYIKSVIKRIIYGDFSKENPDIKDQIDLANFPKNFETIGIDGGAINNEPYREVVSILKGKHHKKDSDHQNFGLIMIDPFPDNDDQKENYKKPKGLLNVVPKILGMLMNQSRVKRKEMIEQYSTDYFKGVIYPSKHIVENGVYKKKDKNPIASASFNAFGGFLDVRFRQHDFFLGRNNARNFLRYYCSMPYNKAEGIVHPMHTNWTNEMIEQFKIENNGEVFLPIIPDLNLVLDNVDIVGDEKYNYTYHEKPKYNPEKLFQLKGKIELRFKYIIDKLFEQKSNSNKTDKKETLSITEEWLKKEYKQSFWKRIKSNIGEWLINKIKKPLSNIGAGLITKAVIKMILEDLEKKQILSEPEK